MSTLLERRRKSRFCSRNVIIQVLRFLWATIVIWCEYGAFFYSLTSCRWPDKAFKQAGSNQQTKPTHVLLISDPQVRNPATYTKPWFGFSSQTSPLKKSWSITSRLRPHVIIFLGDMLATGRQVASSEEYERYYGHFNGTFSTEPHVPVYFIPGNNDVGLGVSPLLSKHAREHYATHFGPFNQEITIAGHNLILLDAPALVEEDYRRHGLGKSYDDWNPLPGGPVQFLKSIASENRNVPSLLFSHIPLSRPSSKSCGPRREKGTLQVGAGPGYQNMLGKQTTEFLLDTLHPSAVFSGDDRDYCDYTHNSRSRDGSYQTPVREVTVKSFSPARYIRRPGFQLLSLLPPQTSSTSSSLVTFADAPCLLPDKRGIFNAIYLPCIVVTLLALFFLNVSPSRHRRRFSAISSISISPRETHNSSPLPKPESAIWSAFSPNPAVKARTSPINPLPPTLRVSNTTTPTNLRAFSGPTSPQESPLLSPITLFTPEDDADDSMHPTQYSSRHDRHFSTTAWSPAAHDNHNSSSFFLPPPTNQPFTGSRGWSWSRTFVLGGQRRRITVGMPTSLIPRSLSSAVGRLSLGKTGENKRRGLLWRVAGDAVSVVLPAVIIGSIISWLML